MEIVNATNFKIDFLVEENKLLGDKINTLKNKIKPLETIPSAKGIPDLIIINELYGYFSRKKKYNYI